MKITGIVWRDDHGMDSSYSVGYSGVTEIEEHAAQGDGDKWYYLVKFEDGKETMIFRFDQVYKSPK